MSVCNCGILEVTPLALASACLLLVVPANERNTSDSSRSMTHFFCFPCARIAGEKIVQDVEEKCAVLVGKGALTFYILLFVA